MRLAVVLFVALFFLAAVSGVAASEPGEHTAPLDRGYEKVGEATVDGTTYEVYRYDNILPYASGYEFFDGEGASRTPRRRGVSPADTHGRSPSTRRWTTRTWRGSVTWDGKRTVRVPWYQRRSPS